MSRLKHHRAVVTGAGAGIGRAIAQRLAEEGAKVVVNDLHAESAEATVALISKAGGTAIASPGDVSNPQDVDKAYRLCEDTWAHCTLAVNNAGIVHQARLAELDLADWDRMIAVHLRGCFIGCRRAIESSHGGFEWPADTVADFNNTLLIKRASSRPPVVLL